MLVVTQMLQCIKQRCIIGTGIEHIAEKHYQRTFVNIFGNKMQGIPLPANCVVLRELSG